MLLCAGLCCRWLPLYVVPETLKRRALLFEEEKGCPERILQVGTRPHCCTLGCVVGACNCMLCLRR
jgi:hypothetical protein